jgi:hypothetical protein
MAPEQAYTQLRLSSEAAESPIFEKSEWESLEGKKSRRKCLRKTIPYALTFLCGILLGIAFSAASKPVITSISQHFEKTAPAPSPKPAPIHEISVNEGFVISPKTGEAKCGNNWQDAKRLGCHFDVMASRWYSHDCYNGAVLEQMMTEVDFEWFYDPEHTKPAPRDLVVKGEFDEVYPLYDYHIIHCLYLWRRLHSALVEHRHLDDDVYSYGHTLHCTRLTMGWKAEKNTTTIATSGIPFCRNESL